MEKREMNISKELFNIAKLIAVKYYYHGTTKKRYESILKNGFNYRLLGDEGTGYGKGIYFASPKDKGYQKYIKLDLSSLNMFPISPFDDSDMEYLLLGKKYRNKDIENLSIAIKNNNRTKKIYLDEARKSVYWKDYKNSIMKNFIMGNFLVDKIDQLLLLVGYDGFYINTYSGDDWAVVCNIKKLNKLLFSQY